MRKRKLNVLSELKVGAICSCQQAESAASGSAPLDAHGHNAGGDASWLYGALLRETQRCTPLTGWRLHFGVKRQSRS